MGATIFPAPRRLKLANNHSNAEEMLMEEGGTPKTSHTTNKVPFVMANAPEGWSLKKQDGVLGDVAPTVLAAMGLEQPKEMTGGFNVWRIWWFAYVKMLTNF
jgi:2,3-bisphosphoglycerate-independent phosphoglycerate mutase